jgi:hypothetical protein
MTARQPLSNLESLISRQWDEDIVAQLVEYVRIPAKSPHFDPKWREHGHIEAELLVTGVLGPKSKAHGPNEFIDIGYAKKITAATAMVIAAMK